MKGGAQRFGPALLRSLPGWTAAVIAGAAADAAGVPLAWILGPLIATAALSISGLPPIVPVESRRFGQVIVGTAVGLNITPEAAARLPSWLPVMILAAVFSIVVSGALSGALARTARVDRATAYFAVLPGGLSEMASVGSAFGARSEAVSLSHALRIALAVILVPALVVLIEYEQLTLRIAQREVASVPMMLLFGASALIGMRALKLVRLANPWLLGALAAAAILSGAGLAEVRLPDPLLWLGQLLIGMSLGIRFKRDIVLRLPLFGLASAATSLVLGAILFGMAAAFSAATAADLPSLLLGLSPGGFVEMTLTARALNLDIALVTGFHFVRAFTVNSIAGVVWERWFARL